MKYLAGAHGRIHKIDLISMAQPSALTKLNRQIICCTRCPRLRAYCQAVATEKRRAYLDSDYWGRPLPGFGDPAARLLVLGLAPAAHGGNRTGRVFTGDRSGDFLMAALHRAGFASQPTSTNKNDGLVLKDAYITAAVKCAPPGNKPTQKEIDNCRPFLNEELRLLNRVRVVLALGRIAFEWYLDHLRQFRPRLRKKDYPFRHGAIYRMDKAPLLIACYHPSQQNTFTKKLTANMLDAVLRKAKDAAVANE